MQPASLLLSVSADVGAADDVIAFAGSQQEAEDYHPQGPNQLWEDAPCGGSADGGRVWGVLRAPPAAGKRDVRQDEEERQVRKCLVF